MAKFRTRLGLAGIALLLVGTAVAAEPIEAELAICRDTPAPDARLACYDRLAARRLAATAAVQQAPESVPVAGSERPPEPPPRPTESTPRAGAPVADARVPQPTGELAPPDAPERFGIEQVEREADTPDVLESRIVGDFEGWSGDTRFELENGQVWRQVQSGRARHRGPANPKVWIRKRAFGSYRLQVEGSNRTIRVERIR